MDPNTSPCHAEKKMESVVKKSCKENDKERMKSTFK